MEEPMTTARLPYELEEKLDAISKAKHVSKTDCVREAVQKYLDQEIEDQSSWELGEPFFGNYGSGDGDLSTDYKNRLQEKIDAKHHTD
jgi:Arc/MetJ-type ribon-helix-helix transcriptional regulator